MRVYSQIRHVPLDLQQSAVVIGNFDGVHLGHKKLIEKARASIPDNMQLCALTFDPHPRTVLYPEADHFSITMRGQKYAYLAQAGVDAIFSLRFNEDLSKYAAYEFVDEILYKSLMPKKIIVGKDFKFGYLKEGTSELLKSYEEEFGFETLIVDKEVDKEKKEYSSSLIRKNLQEGNLDAANIMLGRNWAIEGIVEHGDERGRKLGFPTANISMQSYLMPKPGVYAVKLHTDNDIFDGISNIGTRPTFKGKKRLLETHIFEFNEDIYEQRVVVEILKFLREERAFSDMHMLKKQVAQDCIRARDFLSDVPSKCLQL